MKTYRDLLIWQKSMALVSEVYKLTKSFPNEEMFGLSAQLRKASVSVPSNIAEGYGRNSTKDYVRFLHIAIGSLYEIQTQIEIAFELKYLPSEDFTRLDKLMKEIERMISSLLRKLK
ncbi:MAG TPA: four helix bundle protein [Caldithrix abyssi]|uniref:Four helix bundle protein n=1 Tax=Caldithrix abyssi TaxID=187145 RepID=A0A7V4U077_CALAY|nr:four helix bundle protein [Caldithrix abyssi]